MAKKSRLFSKFVCVLFLLFAACHKGTEPNVFYTYIQSDPAKLDPFYCTDVVAGRILANMFNGLFRIDQRGLLVNDLVHDYTFDGKTLVARIKKDVRFHNGNIVSAHDIAFSFTRIKDSNNPTSPRKWVFDNIQDINATDARTVAIRLKKISSTFLYLLTMPNCYIISKDAYEKNGSVIGTGPFAMHEWRRDEQITLKANAGYFDKRPDISAIVYKVIPEDLTARFEFLNNTLDYFELPFLSNVKWNNTGNMTMTLKGLNVHYVALNTQRYPFNNNDFRKALNIAIDRPAIKKALFGDRFEIAKGPVPTGVGQYKSTATAIEYNPQKAKQIIRSMNISKEIVIYIKADHQVNIIAQMLQHYLSRAGLTVNIQEKEWSALKAATLKGEFDMAYFTWHADYPEPENFLYPLFYSKNAGAGGNRSFYNNSDVDSLLDKACATLDTNKRFAIYNNIERIIIDDAPWIFLWYGDKRIALSKRIKEYSPCPLYSGVKGNEIILQDGHK